MSSSPSSDPQKIDFQTSDSREDTLRKIRTADSIAIPVDVFEKLYLNPQQPAAGHLRKTFGNPTPVALVGFLISATPNAIALMGWRGSGGGGGAILTVFLFFGGMLQIIGGTMEFILGNTFSSVLFFTYGMYTWARDRGEFADADFFRRVLACSRLHAPTLLWSRHKLQPDRQLAGRDNDTRIFRNHSLLPRLHGSLVVHLHDLQSSNERNVVLCLDVLGGRLRLARRLLFPTCARKCGISWNAADRWGCIHIHTLRLHLVFACGADARIGGFPPFAACWRSE